MEKKQEVKGEFNNAVEFVKKQNKKKLKRIFDNPIILSDY